MTKISARIICYKPSNIKGFIIQVFNFPMVSKVRIPIFAQLMISVLVYTGSALNRFLKLK